MGGLEGIRQWRETRSRRSARGRVVVASKGRLQAILLEQNPMVIRGLGAGVMLRARISEPTERASPPQYCKRKKGVCLFLAREGPSLIPHKGI